MTQNRPAISSFLILLMILLGRKQHINLALLILSAYYWAAYTDDIFDTIMLMPPAFLFVGGFISSTLKIPLPLHSTRMPMSKSLQRPSSTASFASTASSTTNNSKEQGDKPRILCLHGKFQSGAIFSNKIAGARRKICREYELDFLDGPIILEQEDGDTDNATEDLSKAPRAWWVRSDDGKHTLVKEALEYVRQQTEAESYAAIIGFSQGGTLATALALSGALPNVRAVVTAGAPYISEAFDVATELSKDSCWNGSEIPKLHLAGETDALVSVESMRELCEKGGNGKFILHDQGHLFPTRSARVKEVLDFLGESLSEK